MMRQALRMEDNHLAQAIAQHQEQQEVVKRINHGDKPARRSFGLPDILVLNVLTFLSPQDLLRSLTTCTYYKQLATSDLLWKLLCLRTWPSMVSTLAPHLDTLPDGYRHFYLRHLRALHQSRHHQAALNTTSPLEHFQSMTLLVDVRNSQTDHPIYSTAIPLHDPSTLRKIFKAEIYETKAYRSKDPRHLFHYQGSPLGCDTRAMSDDLAFTLTLWDSRTNRQAVLCSGYAETDPVFNTYGPSYGHRGIDLKYFGEGGCFMSSIPIFGWFFLGLEQGGRMVMNSLAVEICYRDSARKLIKGRGDGTGDEEDEEDDEVLDCLRQVVTTQLQWV